MNVFEFVIIVVILSLIYKLFAGWMRHRTQVNVEEPARAALVQRLDEVEERVRVLERIVTDERFDLKQQFKELER
jgi:uncharacterized protein involved in tellurium resistance